MLFCYVSVSLACVNFSLGKGDGGQQNWPKQGWGGGQTKGPLGGWDDEPSNPWGGGGGGWKLEDSIPGIPGQSYPNYDKIPDTSFDCRRQKNPGYYGDVESQCQVFHICQAGGRQNSFLCPIGTIFNQESFVCDWWFNVNCGEAPTHYDRNGNLFRGSDIGIDGSKIMRKGQQGNSKGSNQPSAVGIPSWGSQGGDDSSWGMKGNVNQGGQQNPWRNQGGSNKGGSSRRGRPNANGGGQNKGSARGNQGGQSWQNGGNPGFQNKGNQKGIGMGGNQGNQKGLGMGVNQGGQKGFGMGGNVNPGWGQQGNRVNSGRNNKGMAGNQIRQDRGGGFGQKGDMSGGNRIQRRSGMGPNNKGGRRGQKGQGGNNMRPGNAGGGMGNQGTKGTGTDNRSFSANSWSMGSQNFQFSSFQEKSDAFSNGPNAKGGSSSYQENNSWQGPGANDNFQQGGHFKGEDGNNNWNHGNSDFNQWGSRVPEYQPAFGENNPGGQDNWRADYDAPNVNSFNLNDKGSFEGQAGENDYDYVWNS
ncbi:chitin-binding type-2 domain-containing protein [Trichonephila inaurata madagascariensis]|uniref:Chitin-binding type-2 domain-containing protein n=1 Tax=Trichonephila inaurata madagascariensis TaxID=2747483 RepID=A0A8X6IHY6_9ARAC|nr:chitin-binding type-2 domain-containing protein [Trichonephila inaurata madagascariensis]